MSPIALPRPLRGIIVPIITPLVDPGTLDPQALQRVISHVLEGGVRGLFVLGSTGESPSLSMELRRTIIDESCAAAAGRVPVVVNVSETCFAQAQELAAHAAGAGASAVALSPPCYFPLPQRDVLGYARRFSEAVSLPVFLYNVPQYAHNEFAPETVQELSQHSNIIGIKNSSGSLEYLKAVRDSTRHRPDFAVLVGNEEKLLPALNAGADGGVCGGANMFPALYVQLYNAVLEGSQSRAETLHDLVVRVAEAVYTIGPVQTNYLRGLKCALSLLEVCGDALAEPLRSFDASERAELESRLKAILLLLEMQFQFDRRMERKSR